MERQKVVGTNCYNCMYVSKNSETVESKELNSQGGIDQSTDDTLKRAEKADLITLPGGSAADTTDKKFCNSSKNPDVRDWSDVLCLLGQPRSEKTLEVEEQGSPNGNCVNVLWL